MVRFFFWCFLVVSLLANSAAAQNPFSVLDIFGGSEKKSDAMDKSESAKASPAATPSNLDDETEAQKVDRVESIEKSGSDAPPFPQTNEAEKTQPAVKSGEKNGTKEKVESKKATTATPATPATTEDLEELPQPEPQSVLKTESKPALQPALQPEPKSAFQQPSLQPALEPAPKTTLQPATQVAPRDAYFGASIKKGQQGRMGVEVTTVAPDSPAEAAGIRPGDVLISFAGAPVTSSDEFQDLIELLVPGDRVELELMRGRSKEQTLVTLADGAEAVAVKSKNIGPEVRPDPNVAPASDLSASRQARNLVVPADERLMNQPKIASAQPTNQPTNQSTNQRPQLGVVVVDGVEETRNGFRREVRTGAAVETVRANSPAAISGVPVGALIVAANGRRVETANDLVQYVNTLRPGQVVALTFYVDSRQYQVPVTLAAGKQEATSVQAAQPNLQYSQQQLQQQELLLQQQARQQSVRQAADFQPVPGNTGLETAQEQEVERPLLKRFGERMPLLRRVDNMIDRFEQPVVQDGVIMQSPQQVAPQSQSQSRQLEETIRQQQQQIEGLNRRLRDLESRRRR